MRHVILLLVLIGCSGYRFTQQENPLSQYGIRSLSIPMFYNYSNSSEVSADFTREVYRVLAGFSGLRLESGYNKNTDAVLIGIVKSPEKLAETFVPGSPQVAQEQVPLSVGDVREDFYFPGSTNIRMSLQVILIKRPTEAEIALLQSGIGGKIEANSRIIFNETIPLNGSYLREVLDGVGTEVVATQNSGVQRKSVKKMAEQAAISIRDMILYAF